MKKFYLSTIAPDAAPLAREHGLGLEIAEFCTAWNMDEKFTGVEIVLENILEREPQWLLDIVKGVDDPRLKLCLDVGHVNAYSNIPVMQLLETCAPYISHFHIHNNDTSRDQHNPLNEGTIPMKELLEQIGRLCPDATSTLELMKAKSSVQWLMEENLWNC